MIKVNIPGRGDYVIEKLLLDYNGTIALDGTLLPGVGERITRLAESLEVILVTADTHGTAAKNCEGLPIKVLTYPTEHVAEIKAKVARELGGGVICVGNGYNDMLMADESMLSVAVMGTEGCCAALLAHCDIAVTSILDALDLLIYPDRLRATLRA